MLWYDITCMPLYEMVGVTLFLSFVCFILLKISPQSSNRVRYHGEQHVKKIYSTVAIDKRGHALKPVRGYSFRGEDTNTRVPWLLKNEIIFNISIYISFMRTPIYKFY